MNKKSGKVMGFGTGMWLLLLIVIGCRHTQNTENPPGDSIFFGQAYARQDSASLRRLNQQTLVTRQNAITRASAAAGPAVVGINVMQLKRYVQPSPYARDPFYEFFFPEMFRDRIIEKPVQSLGSGFLISPDGYIVTNEHVVEDASEIIITLPGGDQHKAEQIGADRISDIALLKIDVRDYPCLKLGNSDEIIVGEWVIALGNPFGLFELNDQPTVTVGVVSAINRDWGRNQQSGRVYVDMIQTDAAINHGNSGGPLVNALGEVIGMNTFIYTGNSYQHGFVGIGFAIPVNRISKVVEEIKAYGEVNRNYWLGFKVQDLDPHLIRAYDLNIREGVIVTQVEDNSSTAEAGLKPEDIIIRVNNKNIKNSRELLNTLVNMDLQVGDTLSFTILRNSKTKQMNIKLLENPQHHD